MQATVFNNLKVGGKTACVLNLVSKGSFTLDPASIAAAGSAVQTVTVAGAQVGDLVELIPPAAIEAFTISKAYVSGANTVKFVLANNTAGAIDGASRVWGVLLVRAS